MYDKGFAKAYTNETIIIKASGGDRDALQFRFNELKHQRGELLKYIEQRSFEFAGREEALKEFVKKLDKLGD